MTDTPNPAEFSVNEKPNDYEVYFTVTGEVCVKISASNKEEATTKAEAILDDEEFGVELDRVDEARIKWVRKEPPMYRVLRDGSKMQVSHLKAGDAPRPPDERDF